VGGGTTDTGLKIFAPDKVLRNGFNGNIWIGTRLYYDEIKSQLINDYGIDESLIKNIGKVIGDMAVRQYFDLKDLPHVDKEVFLDVGCLDGMTSRRFFKWAGNCEAQTYCFEPDAKNRLKVERNLASVINDGNASVIPYAAWDRKESLHFHENGNGVSRIADDGVTVNASTIDDEIPESERATFIKMDIEGAELKALRGAKRTISQNHPKLAISVYHKPQDIITLADEILKIDGSYKFYLRHYSLADGETVLYGI
jgi:FkbM family methyltransferase